MRTLADAVELKGLERKHTSTSSRNKGGTRQLAITSVLLMIFFSLSGGTNAAQAQTVAYVSNSCSQAIFVVDIANSSVLTSIFVEAEPFELEITPDGTRVYVATLNNLSVAVIDTATNTVSDTIPVPVPPYRLAMSRDGSRVYTAGPDSQVGSFVSVIDTATNTVIAIISVDEPPLGELAVTPDGTRMYMTLPSSVAVINTVTNTVLATIPVGGWAIAITPDGTRAYMASAAGLSVIDTTTNTVTATVRVDGLPTQIAITPDGTRAYVMNEHNHNISVIDTATNTVIDIIPINFPIFMEFTSNGALAYLLTGLGSIPGSNSIVGLDMATHAVISEVNVKSCSRRFALTSDSLIPTTQDDCKDGGYRRFGPPAGPFRNQGQCVSYVESQSRRRR